jgi:plasmid stabilization system protein ParE
VYFREVGGEVEIVRVLHERTLPERHLRFSALPPKPTCSQR